jgi:hypothetical protein
MQLGDIYKLPFARSDLEVILDSVAVKPAPALGSWIALTGSHAHVTGDKGLAGHGIAPVTKRLVQGGLEVAVHRHILRAPPATLCMHSAGTSDP